MKVEIVELVKGRADVSVFDDDGREACRMLVEVANGKVVLHYDLYDGTTHANIVAKVPPLSAAVTLDLTDEEKRLALAFPNQIIPAVRSIRERTKCSLVEGKRMVDAFRALNGWVNPIR